MKTVVGQSDFRDFLSEFLVVDLVIFGKFAISEIDGIQSFGF